MLIPMRGSPVCVCRSAAVFWTSSGIKQTNAKWTTCKQQQNYCCYTEEKAYGTAGIPLVPAQRISQSILMLPKCILMPKDCTFIIPFLWALPSQSTRGLRLPCTQAHSHSIEIQHSQIKHLHCLGPKCNKNPKYI